MQLLDGQELVNTLRELCDQVRSRLWIASPFLGDPRSVRCILGNRWHSNPDMLVRLITDASETGGADPRTIDNFRSTGEARQLKGLHGKVYIVDDHALVTSANLTRTAFSMKYEVGILLSEGEAEPVLDLFERWWGIGTEDFPERRRTARGRGRTETRGEETSTQGLKQLWNLPPDPGSTQISVFLDYDRFLKSYREFADLYDRTGPRAWPKTPLFFETDSFLNYLYHHAPGTPSKKHVKGKPRAISGLQRRKDAKKYAASFKKWLSRAGDTQSRREKSSRTIQRLLSKNHITKITWSDIEKVTDQLNCLNSVRLAKHRFLNPQNNDVRGIRRAWRDLLYGKGSIQARMSSCTRPRINYFGKSSVQELLGFFDPDQYPLRNRNSNAGLRFLGYDVPIT